MNLREYAFERFRESYMAAERKQDVREVREIVFIAVDSWKKDYRLLAAVWLFLVQRLTITAENQQYDLARNYGPMLDLIVGVTARRYLSREDYQAFGRLALTNPLNTPYQEALKEWR